MTPLDYLAKEYVELTMVKQRYDSDDVYFFVDRPFWKRDSLNFSHEYKSLRVPLCRSIRPDHLTTSSSRQRGCSNA